MSKRENILEQGTLILLEIKFYSLEHFHFYPWTPCHVSLSLKTSVETDPSHVESVSGRSSCMLLFTCG